MISVLSHYKNNDFSVLELMGKSVDIKPTTKYLGLKIANGSSFIEMDTGSIYFYDAETASWLNFGGDG